MKHIYLKFIKWDEEFALFKKANTSDLIISGFWPVNVLAGICKIEGYPIVVIKVPKSIINEDGEGEIKCQIEMERAQKGKGQEQEEEKGGVKTSFFSIIQYQKNKMIKVKDFKNG